ncbi:MAG: hypothetical protein K2N38_11460 [Oscillospiraceae bacterium]|nr:hypothetical protein [Oscillospiraceae bacterium]
MTEKMQANVAQSPKGGLCAVLPKVFSQVGGLFTGLSLAVTKTSVITQKLHTNSIDKK